MDGENVNVILSVAKVLNNCEELSSACNSSMSTSTHSVQEMETPPNLSYHNEHSQAVPHYHCVSYQYQDSPRQKRRHALWLNKMKTYNKIYKKLDIEQTV